VKKKKETLKRKKSVRDHASLEEEKVGTQESSMTASQRCEGREGHHRHQGMIPGCQTRKPDYCSSLLTEKDLLVVSCKTGRLQIYIGISNLRMKDEAPSAQNEKVPEELWEIGNHSQVLLTSRGYRKRSQILVRFTTRTKVKRIKGLEETGF